MRSAKKLVTIQIETFSGKKHAMSMLGPWPSDTTQLQLIP